MQQNIISNFFRPINTDIQIPDSEYAKTDVCIVMADALARNTNHSLYIIDYHRKNFLYVSSNPLFSAVIHRKKCNKRLCLLLWGCSVWRDKPSYGNQRSWIPVLLWPAYRKRLDLSIEYNFHIHTSEKHPHLIHHKLTPVLLSGKGDIWLALCTVSLSPEKTSEM